VNLEVKENLNSLFIINSNSRFMRQVVKREKRLHRAFWLARSHCEEKTLRVDETEEGAATGIQEKKVGLLSCSWLP